MSGRRSNLAVPIARQRPRRGWYDAVARHRFAPWLAAGVALVVQGVPTLVSGPPAPQFHDEFSYLLAADTFARGRLTNPTPAGWEHLETFQVIFHPTYQSKYPPGQGLILALGRVLANEPIVGVWVAVALACAAVVWMLRAWLPPRRTFTGLLAIRMAMLGGRPPIAPVLTPAAWPERPPHHLGRTVLVPPQKTYTRKGARAGGGATGGGDRL